MYVFSFIVRSLSPAHPVLQTGPESSEHWPEHGARSTAGGSGSSLSTVQRPAVTVKAERPDTRVSHPPPPVTRASQWSGNPYGNGYGVEMDGNGAQFVKR